MGPSTPHSRFTRVHLHYSNQAICILPTQENGRIGSDSIFWQTVHELARLDFLLDSLADEYVQHLFTDSKHKVRQMPRPCMATLELVVG